MTGSTKICLFARPYLAPDGDIDAYLEIARLADDAGIHSICFGEHLVIGEATDRYPFGRWVHGLESPWPDPLVVMSAVAAVTTRVRLSTAILIATLRPALVLAKEVATLDVVSHGRVELGLGTGWQAEEYAGVGLAWSERQDRLDTVVANCRKAWGTQPFTVESDEGPIGPLRAFPRPVQERIPLFYGMKATPRTARRIATLGDGWTPVAVTTDDVRRGTDLIRSEFDAAGRDPGALTIRIGLPTMTPAAGPEAVRAAFDAAPELIDAGTTELVVGFNDRLDSLNQAAEFIQAIAETAALTEITGPRNLNSKMEATA